MLGSFSVFICFIAVLIYKRFNKTELDFDPEGGEMSERQSIQLSDDVIREYDVLELPV